MEIGTCGLVRGRMDRQPIRGSIANDDAGNCTGRVHVRPFLAANFRVWRVGRAALAQPMFFRSISGTLCLLRPMKRLTQRLRQHHFHRAKREAWKRRCRRKDFISGRRDDAKERFQALRAQLPPPVLDYTSRPAFCSIVPPAKLCLLHNYDETLSFILAMRALFYAQEVPSEDRRRTVKVFSDFAALSEIEPAAGLVLAAELDRWRLVKGRPPRAYHRDWQPAVRRYFIQAGLFGLLGIEQPTDDGAPPDGHIETLKFIRGFSVYGKPGSLLRDRLEALSGKSLGPRPRVYDAIAEAIANTRHAYPTGVSIWPSKQPGRWWASGSWNRSTNVVSIQIYDQGVGIPATLPRSDHWSDILARIPFTRGLNPEGRDDQLLVAALEVGRTSTHEPGRGKGLAEMASWIDLRGSGFLRITSGGGMIVYRAGGKTTSGSLSAGFPGTLIEWEIALDD